MNLQSAASGFLAFLLLIPGYLFFTALQGKTDWKVTYTSSHICAPKGSTVNINCNYEYPVKNFKSKSSTILLESLWFTKMDRIKPVDIGNETEYKSRVEYICGQNQCRRTASVCSGACTLRIRDLKPSDSAEYKFWITTAQTDWGYTGSPGVNLTVTDLQVTLDFLHSEEPTWLDLECHSICNIATTSYKWFRNGENAGTGRYYRGDRVIINSEDSYACAVKGFERFPSPSVYAPKTPSVTVSPSGEIEEGSSVTLSCSSDANPAAEYTWFKEHDDSVEESGKLYTITNIKSELGGNYYCQAHNAIGHHNSTFLIIKVTSSSSSSSSSSHTAMVAVSTIVALLATILLVFIWMRRKRASSKACGQGGRPDTVGEPLPVSVRENVSALTNNLAPAAQREPIEEQDEPHYASIHTSRSDNQEVPRCWVGSNVQSDQADAVFYSVVNIKRPNAVPGESEKTEAAETSELYSTVKKHPRY